MDGLVVVTGANGHIGNNLCRQLLEHGYNVRGTVRSLDKAPDLDMEFVEADVLVAEDWDNVLQGATGLFHLATIYATSGDGNLSWIQQTMALRTYSGLLLKLEYLG